MLKLSVCLLTCNSSRLLREVLPPLLKVADEFIVIDSGSTDATLQICQQFGLTVHHHAYTTHGTQMNYATSLASHDWVLCMDSDEILDDEVVAAILALKAGDEPDPPAHGVCRATGSCWVKRCAPFIRYHRRISRFACLTAPSPGSTIGR
jgi:glycosyltransferase involved in cell wall biosynthesis